MSQIGYNTKYSIEYVRQSFESENYQLLTEKYINCKQHLEYICDKGHHHRITFDSWLRGRRCPYCKKTIKKTIKEIKQAFENEGYKLLTTEYKNSKQKLEYICPVGHRHWIAWEKWQTGVRCFYCFGTPKKTLKEIQEAFKKEGFTLLSKNYTSSQQKLDYICPFGHRHSISWNNWRIGNRCPYCDGNAKKNLEDIEKAFNKEGYQLLSHNYKNSEQKLKYICPQGHMHSIRWRNWQGGARCPECGNREITKKAKQRWKDPIYRRIIAKAFARKPNKPESFLNETLQKLFPNEYKYVGDFQFFLGGKNPDFMNINGQKKLIEMYGDYWHKNDDPQKRINHFEQYGFKTLIIWERELKNYNVLLKKIKEFHKEAI